MKIEAVRAVARAAMRPSTALAFGSAALLCACGGPQSALDPAGREAETLARMFWIMLAGAAVIWVLVIGAAVLAMIVRPHPSREWRVRSVLLGGGVTLPVFVLAALLTYGLSVLPDLRKGDDGLSIAVTGEQWWWRVVYRPEAGEPVASANEIRLPAGERTELVLGATDVIHSLWIPPLGGKMDMIPGRTSRLVLEPTRTGVFRGACAEYCGASHALMALSVIVMEKDAFSAWLARQREPASAPAGPAARRGRELFLAVGCGGCHTVRGSGARGTIGPDLTHVGGRRGLGAAILPNDRGGFIRWIAHTGAVKPEVKMPSFGVLGEEDVAAIAAYLAGLK